MLIGNKKSCIFEIVVPKLDGFVFSARIDVLFCWPHEGPLVQRFLLPRSFHPLFRGKMRNLNTATVILSTAILFPTALAVATCHPPWIAAKSRCN